MRISLTLGRIYITIYREFKNTEYFYHDNRSIVNIQKEKIIIDEISQHYQIVLLTRNYITLTTYILHL